MPRPELKGLRYFPLDTGFFGDRKIRLLRGEHGADGVEVYLRIVIKCYEDNGYYLIWSDDEDYPLMAEETGHSKEKLQGIMSTLFRRSLLCKLPVPGNDVIAPDEGTTLYGRSMANEHILPMPGNVITSRGIQRRYFGAIKETRVKAAAQGRHTYIEDSICLLSEDDFAELNKPQCWLKVTPKDRFSGINQDKSGINSNKSTKNPPKKSKEKKSKETSLSQLRCDEEIALPKTERFPAGSDEMKLAQLLFEEMRRNNPRCKEPNLQMWCGHIDLMIRRDGRTPEEIRKVLLFSQGDPFWMTNILSTEKLRKQFDQLTLKMQSAEEAEPEGWDL